MRKRAHGFITCITPNDDAPSQGLGHRGRYFAKTNMDETIPDSSKPPMQNAPGVFSSTPYGSGLFYRFASVRNTEAGVELCVSLPILETPDADQDTVVEKVVENYAVHIPITKEIDGELVTTHEVQHRTRTFSIVKRRSENENYVKREYIACVPYTEMIDGRPIAQSRLETRTRLVSENEIPQELAPYPRSTIHDREKLSFYDLHGKEIEIDEVLNGTGGYVPVIQIASVNHVVPYFSSILNPNARFLVIRDPDIAK